MYLLQYRLLKKKMECQIKKVRNLPKLESMSYGLNLFSVPFFLLAILLGCIWGYTKLDNFHWYDTKVIGSFVVLFVYCAYIFTSGRCVAREENRAVEHRSISRNAN